MNPIHACEQRYLRAEALTGLGEKGTAFGAAGAFVNLPIHVCMLLRRLLPIYTAASAAMSSFASATPAAAGAGAIRLIDIGANLTDPMFSGFYNHGRSDRHPPDLDAVLDRAREAGVEKIIVTAGSLAEAHPAVVEVRIEEFDNRILVGGPEGLGARSLRAALRQSEVLRETLPVLSLRTLSRRRGSRGRAC